MKAGSRRSTELSARKIAFRVLRAVEEKDAYASILLDHFHRRVREPRDAALAREIVLGILRRLRILDHVIGALATRPIDRIDPVVRRALRIGTYEILFLDRIPDFASVDSAVELVKSTASRSAAGFVNGVLRAAARRGKEHLPPDPRRGDVAALALHRSHPAWWVERLVERHGWDAAARILEADNDPAPTVLYPNLRRIDTERLASLLDQDGVKTERCRYVPEALRVLSGPVWSSGTLPEGLAWVQDEASQLVPRMFGTRPGPRIADLCAAPGGKTLQLALRLGADGSIAAYDRNETRLRRMRENLDRVGAPNIILIRADTSRPGPQVKGPFDDVLVDAPCTGTGTLRRNPEIRWRLGPADPPRMARLQRRLLEVAAGLVAPGGRVVYSVCSLEPEEGEGVRDAFLRDHPEFAVADPTGNLPSEAGGLVDREGCLRTSPETGGLDGFFGVLFRRAARDTSGA